MCPPHPHPDGYPKETGEQELGSLYGALQGEQIPEREKRLWHHPFLPGDELTLHGKDDHPQGQAEHGQRLDAALTTSREPPDTSHSLLLLYERGRPKHTQYTHTHTPRASASPAFSLCEAKMLYKRQNKRLVVFPSRVCARCVDVCMHGHMEPVWAAVRDAAQGGALNCFFFLQSPGHWSSTRSSRGCES